MLNTTPIRKLFNQIFDDPTLDAFCQDYFPVVFDRFSRGMRKDEKITLLLDYCRRHSFEALRQAVFSEYEVNYPQNDALKALAEAIGLSLEQPPVVSHSPDTSDKESRSIIDNPQPTSKGVEMKDFFVSYNGKDKTWAEWIAWQLEDAGYTTVIQAWDFRPGGNFVLDMQKAAAEAQRTIAVLSPNYVDTLYTQPEWAAAFAQDPTGEKKTLLPVRVKECELKGLLSQIVYIDLVGLTEIDAREALLASLKSTRAKPTRAPIFPGIIQHTVPKPESFPGESDSPSEMIMAQIQLIIAGETTDFTDEKRSILLSVLSSIFQVKQSEIHILKVLPGSIRVTIEIPEYVLPQLNSLSSAQVSLLVSFGVQSIESDTFRLDFRHESTGQQAIGSPHTVELRSSVPSLPRLKQIKLKALEERRDTLVKQYEAANRQLNSTLAATDKVTIEQQIKNLEQEIQSVEDEINQLNKPA